eukprot:scaffold650189_cov36-Prasinocladus_malaysianus.AAC.1
MAYYGINTPAVRNQNLLGSRTSHCPPRRQHFTSRTGSISVCISAFYARRPDVRVKAVTLQHVALTGDEGQDLSSSFQI